MPSLRNIRVSKTHRFPGASIWRKLGTAWHETSSTLKTAWIALWASGAILLTLGAWGDSAGFWMDKPYLTNTFSALTSAAFGVPVALVVLQRLAATEADAGEARAARRMAARVSADLARTVGALARDGIPAMQAARKYVRDLRESLVPNSDYWRPATAPRLYYQPHIDAIESAMKKIEELFSPEVRQHAAEVSAQWSILTTEVRFRLLSSDNDWLPGLEAGELAALVDKVTGPILRNWQEKGRELQHEYYHEDQQRDSIGRHYGEMETLREFDRWCGEIIDYVAAVTELTAQSASLAEAFSVP